MDAVDEILERLSGSRFRSAQKLGPADAEYLRSKGPRAIASHARDLITRRLAAANPVRDGKQTPWRGHPVFVAQHATATCCRSCLEKWHGIPKGRALTDAEIDRIVEVLCRWLRANDEP